MWYAASMNCPLGIEGTTFNFLPSWWYHHFGIEHNRLIFDADYRVEAHRAMERAMHDRYAEAGLGDPDPPPRVTQPEWGNAQTPAAAGGEVHYAVDAHPASRPLGADAIRRLRQPEHIASTYPFVEILRQVRYLNARHGTDERPTFGVRGVLNDAMLLRGADHLGDILGEPARAHRLMDFCHQLQLSLLHANHVNQSDGTIMLFHCGLMLVGPATYASALLPYDLEMTRLAASLGFATTIHNCGPAHRFAASYERLGPIDLLDIGTPSDLPAVLKTFARTQISYIVDARWLARATPAEIDERMGSLFESARGHLQRVSLNVADIDADTPDDNILALADCVRRLPHGRG